MSASQARSPVVATAPGKLILMGEHAVVYGRPALVAALGLRVRVRLSAGDAPGVELALPDVGVEGRVGWREAAEHARRVRGAWEAYAAQPTPERFARVGAGDPAHLVKTALGELLREVAERETTGAGEPPPTRLRIASELPVGSGFGSSAATAVAVVAAGLEWLGRSWSVETVDRLALEVERRQHGSPSGADHATVLRGGVLRVVRGADGALRITPLRVPPATLERFAVFHTGVPAETTGQVVAAVRSRWQARPRDFEGLLDRMGDAVADFADELAAPAADADRIAELIRAYELCLEELGVVPASLRAELGGAAANGVVAKISGAGSLTEGGAGSLLVFRRSPGAPTPAAFARFAAYPAELGVSGLEVERAA